jgi:hypothetical protein
MVEIDIPSCDQAMDDVFVMYVLQAHQQLHEPTEQQFFAEAFLLALLFLDVAVQIAL